MEDEQDLSLEETNRLRAELGLKPLTLSRPKSAREEPKERSPSPERGVELLSRLEAAKARRQHQKSISGQSLGDSLAHESASDWVKRFKPVPVDESTSQRTKAKSYTSEELEDLRVRHCLDSFAEGKDVVLTLKDSSVLDADSGPELENVDFVEQERIQRNLEKKNAATKPKYDPYSEVKSILPQYDSEEDPVELPGGSFRIGSSGIVDPQDLISRDLERRLDAKTRISTGVQIDLNSSRQMSSDFLPSNSGFRKRPRTDKPKKKILSSLASLIEDEDLQNDSEAHHSSRSDASRLQVRSDLEIQDHLNRAQRYAQALALAEERTQKLPVNEDEIRDDFDETLILSRLRSETSFQRNLDEDVVIHSLEKHEEVPIHDPENRIVFSSAEELIGAVSTPNTGRTSIDPRDTTFKPIFVENVKSTSDSFLGDSVSVPISEGVASTKALLEEPDLKRGVGSALELIRRRGLLQKSTQRKHAGRANDHKGVHFADAADDGVRIEHLDEFGRPMTEKEAFRHLSYAFHNQAPGLKKRAKRLKEREREIKMKRLVRGDGEDALNKIQKAVQSAGKAYVVLDAKGRSIASTVAQKKTDIGQPALESSRTSEPSEIHVPETPALASDTSSSTRQTPRIEFELSTR